ncbi:MAG: VOC family protein [Solirubrobacteraceae bacterium]
MFDHVTLRVADREASEPFYDTVLGTLGVEKAHSGEVLAEWQEFSISPATAERLPTQRLHIGFRAPSRAHVDEFWRAGTAAGHRDDGVVSGTPTERLHMAFGAASNATVEAFHRSLTEAGHRDNGGPVERPVYHPGYYGAVVLDPDGNSVEIVNHNR